MFDTEAKRRWLARLGLGAVSVVVFGLLAPFLFMAVGGLVAAITFMVIGGAAMALAPAMSMKFANWRIKAIQAEARRNPIQTMTAVLIRRRQDLGKQNAKIDKYEAAVQLFQSKVKSLKRQFPDDQKGFEEQLEGMRKLLALRRERARDAKAQLDVFEAEIDKQKARYEVAMAALQVERQSKNIDDQEVFDKIKINESFDAVELAVGESFAQLSSALDELNYNPSKGQHLQVKQPEPVVIDV
jgi:chromosome segregation ATPase